MRKFNVDEGFKGRGGGNWLRGGVGGRIKVDRGLTKFVLEK